MNRILKTLAWLSSTSSRSIRSTARLSVMSLEDRCMLSATPLMLAPPMTEPVQEARLLPAVQTFADVPGQGSTVTSGGSQNGGKVILQDLSGVTESSLPLAGTDTNPLLMGMLLPAVQKVRESAIEPESNCDLDSVWTTPEVAYLQIKLKDVLVTS